MWGWRDARVCLVMLGVVCTDVTWAQIGCAPSTPSRYDTSTGVKSSACGVNSRHRLGADDGTRGRYYQGGSSYYGSGSSYRSSNGRASELLPYLSPRCAELNDAIRTAPARGVHGDLLYQLQNEYRDRCSDEDAMARSRLYEQRSADRQAQSEAREVGLAQRQLSEREQAQCAELLRILAGRRKRLAELTPGEQGDLQRSEAAYNQRCGR